MWIFTHTSNAIIYRNNTDNDTLFLVKLVQIASNLKSKKHTFFQTFIKSLLQKYIIFLKKYQF